MKWDDSCRHPLGKLRWGGDNVISKNTPPETFSLSQHAPFGVSRSWWWNVSVLVWRLFPISFKPLIPVTTRCIFQPVASGLPAMHFRDLSNTDAFDLRWDQSAVFPTIAKSGGGSFPFAAFVQDVSPACSMFVGIKSLPVRRREDDWFWWRTHFSQDFVLQRTRFRKYHKN